MSIRGKDHQAVRVRSVIGDSCPIRHQLICSSKNPCTNDRRCLCHAGERSQQKCSEQEQKPFHAATLTTPHSKNNLIVLKRHVSSVYASSRSLPVWPAQPV